jgi:hypothetical protein
MRSSGMPSVRYISRQFGEKARRKISASNGTPISRQTAASVSYRAGTESTMVPSQSKRMTRMAGHRSGGQRFAPVDNPNRPAVRIPEWRRLWADSGHSFEGPQVATVAAGRPEPMLETTER